MEALQYKTWIEVDSGGKGKEKSGKAARAAILIAALRGNFRTTGQCGICAS
jgi:hypothetical protein